MDDVGVVSFVGLYVVSDIFLVLLVSNVCYVW